MNEPDPMAAENPMATCKATNRQGEPCGQPAIRGGTVCRYHGGAAPQVAAAAARRVLEALIAPALIQLREILEQDDTPPAVRLRAIRDILDRGGLGAVKLVEHGGGIDLTINGVDIATLQ